MGSCCRKPKKPEPVVELPAKKQAVPEFKPSTFDFLEGITTKSVPKTSVNKRGKINVRDLLPKNMFTEYEKLDLPALPVSTSDFNAEIFIVLNLLRTDQIFFVNNFLETIRARFISEDTFKTFSNETKKSTFGLYGVDSCIKYISEMEKLHPLYWSDALQAVADGTVTIASDNQSQNDNTIELSGSVYEFSQRGAEISFEVITSLLCEDYEEMKILERLCDPNLNFVGISSFVDSIGDNVTRIP